MKKTTKAALLCALIFGVAGTFLTSLYAFSIQSRMNDWKQTARSDALRLRYRVSELEDRVEKLLNRTPEPPASKPTGGTPETEVVTVKPHQSPETTAPAVTTGVHTRPILPVETTQPDAPHNVPDDVPESVPSAGTPDRPTDGPADGESLYIMTEHEGTIAVFDAAGALVRRLNVAVLTLPAADRDALEAGIPAASWEEVLDLIGRYE